MNNEPEILTEVALDYETMVSYATKLFKQNGEDKKIAMIYEQQVPKVSYDVNKAVREMRSSATGGVSDAWAEP